MVEDRIGAGSITNGYVCKKDTPRTQLVEMNEWFWGWGLDPSD